MLVYEFRDELARLRADWAIHEEQDARVAEQYTRLEAKLREVQAESMRGAAEWLRSDANDNDRTAANWYADRLERQAASQTAAMRGEKAEKP